MLTGHIFHFYKEKPIAQLSLLFAITHSMLVFCTRKKKPITYEYKYGYITAISQAPQVIDNSKEWAKFNNQTYYIFGSNSRTYMKNPSSSVSFIYVADRIHGLN